TGALDAIVALIAAEQVRTDRHIIYVGHEPDGIRAELADVQPPWTETVRVVRERGGRVLGCGLCEWDLDLGRSWLFGPWIDGDDATWDRAARPLVDALLAQLPPGIRSHELSGTVDNERLRRLADELGWPTTEVNYAYVLEAGQAGEAPPVVADDGLRGVVADDLGLVAPLHELEFPNSYFSAHQLVERAATGEQTVLVATTDDGHFAGYAAGRVQPDGCGYIDFVAVDPAARGAGAGRRLVTGLVRRLLPHAPKREVHLTVQEHRTPARALYAALGFRPDVGFVGYRSPAG
ncbi:MAG TPA: GNAT family N-acetyltransferase, partial [Ilumatobacteraceae bacterium]|nr:GNAT family N-acetyltransferase [Ilumatobacteraceae bacterium]